MNLTQNSSFSFQWPHKFLRDFSFFSRESNSRESVMHFFYLIEGPFKICLLIVL